MCFLCTLLFSFVLVDAQDKPTKDISEVYAEGKVVERVFGLGHSKSSES